LFRKHDTDNNGILNEEEFVGLLASLNIYGDALEENSLRLLNIIDPYNNKQITFSETVSLFSMVII
jgi:Ca2+-binding EF-hand superfamily protein